MFFDYKRGEKIAFTSFFLSQNEQKTARNSKKQQKRAKNSKNRTVCFRSFRLLQKILINK